MKKFIKIFLLVVAGLFIAFLALGAHESNKRKKAGAEVTPTETVKTTDAPPITTSAPTPTPFVDDTPEEEKTLRGRIKAEYADTVITDFQLNENLGTDKEGDFIALVYLTWNVKNTEATSKDMLKMYSDDLAVYAAENCPAVQELAVFWKIPYLSKNAKYSYERKGDAMYVTDEIWTNY